MEDEILLKRRLDGTDEPKDLPLALFEGITDGFSLERKIGQGGFGAVYKGKLGNVIVAVKRIYINLEKIDDDDKQFYREFNSLWKTNHPNVVRFLGFCSNTYQTPIEKAGSEGTILAYKRERLFCFEYISKGSLDNHITDELRGLEWEKRYEIITGICEALRYLHEEKKIIHMDLKPANILLDDHMVPKITDFGLSRQNDNSHTAGKRYGTRGYMAPEYEKDGQTTFMSDIYNLGVIIIELVTGYRGVPDKHNVLRRWRHRWNKPPTQLQFQQVTGCIDIAVSCKEQDPKARPSIKKIVGLLSGTMDGHTGQVSPCFDIDDMLKIEPLELRLPCELKNEISCSVELTNDTHNCIAFNIQPPIRQWYNSSSTQPDNGIVRSLSKYVLKIKVQARDLHEHKHVDKFSVQSTTVSNSCRDEDVTDSMFRAEAGKIVDEVDLMVVYDSTRPEENCKRREYTNTLGEEAPKAKQRKTAESSPGKGEPSSRENAEANSMDINSSTEGQNINKTGQYNLHTLQSFSRRYPTETTYLWKESERAMDLTRGAMGSLLDKLGKLVREDCIIDVTIKKRIKHFSCGLTDIHGLLPKLENIDDAKIFFNHARELSYNIEDMVDTFLVPVEPDSKRSGFRELAEKGLQLWDNGITSHHQICDVISEIEEQVQDMIMEKDQGNFNVNNVVANATTKASIVDPRMAICEDKEQLIGIEAPTDELIMQFEKDGDVSKQKLKIISIVGMGGLGKTTLAKAVYDKPEAYQHKAFVSVGQNPILITVLKNIIIGERQIYNARELEYYNDLDERKLIEEIKRLLRNKRYFIVIDDLWDCTVWDVISSAFPRDNCGSRVITTTRIQEVVDRGRSKVENIVYKIKPLSNEDSRTLFFTIALGPMKDCPPTKKTISMDILKRCGGMPLAINSIARHLARDESDYFWENVRKSLIAIKGNNIETMKQILDLSYIHLPGHLKTCLLHVCMYPEDREIDKNDLLMQWVAEGFVSTDEGQDAEDVAEAYFKALIHMFMIQPGKIDYNNQVLTCRVHDIILELMKSKASKDNFIHVLDGLKYVTGQIRRVSVQHNDKEDSRILETIKGPLSHARSVLLYRSSLLPDFLTYKCVRVLHLEDEACHRGLDLTSISRLLLLRYLKIACSRYTKGEITEMKLPDQIGALQQLETIDLQGGVLKNYPSDIVSLPWLSHLRYGVGGIMLPEGIDRLESLRTLVGICVHKSSVGSINGLSKLTNLRRLQICSTIGRESEEATSIRMAALHSSIGKLSSNLRILTLGGRLWNIMNVRVWSESLFPKVSNIRELDLGSCTFQRCPEWIGQLNGLYKFTIMVKEVANGVSIVAGLYSLAYFSLHTRDNDEEAESVTIPGGGAFKALKELIFSCPKASLTFDEGAMPNLEKLDIRFRYHMARRFLPVGIQHLQAGTLREISLCMDMDDRVVKGSKHWNEYDWCDYYNSEEREKKYIDHIWRFKTMVKRAFKPHHPTASIVYYMRGGDKDLRGGDHFLRADVHDEEDDNGDFGEEDCCSEEDDENADENETGPSSGIIDQ